MASDRSAAIRNEELAREAAAALVGEARDLLQEYSDRVQALDGDRPHLPHRTMLVGMIAAAVRNAAAVAGKGAA